MNVLVADDDAVSRTVLARTLTTWGHRVHEVADGLAAWAALSGTDRPDLAVLDWMMPGLEGPEVCRRLRAAGGSEYLILLSARDHSGDVVAGLDSGADDFVTKPFDRDELQARLRVGERVIGLQRGLADRVRDLEAALAQVKQLSGLLPICSYCKKVRDDQNYWQRVESYVAARTNARFSHGICPDCWITTVAPQLADSGIPPHFPE